MSSLSFSSFFTKTFVPVEGQGLFIVSFHSQSEDYTYPENGVQLAVLFGRDRSI